jgi:hypothetical protein
LVLAALVGQRQQPMTLEVLREQAVETLLLEVFYPHLAEAKAVEARLLLEVR